jgi:hypothetical protein
METQLNQTQGTTAPMTVEQIASSVGGQVVNDGWDSGEEIKAGWAKLDVGESIKGTLVNKRVQKATIVGYPDQWVYEIKEDDGSLSFIGLSIDKTYINNKLKNLQIGQIIMIKRFADVESKKYKGKYAKSFDARLFGMDEAYIMKEDDIEEIKVD